jgi:CO/xanthine dehydrogenase Mo-binding subunit
MNEATAIEVHIVKSTAAPGGMGEPTAPAAIKAVFAATGKRLRKCRWFRPNLPTCNSHIALRCGAPRMDGQQ